MLSLTIEKTELFNPKDQTFINVNPQTIKLEHSLLSLSKWESKWNVPFLNKSSKSIEQIMDYIEDMTITQNVDPAVYFVIQNNAKLVEQIKNYIDAPMTATTFSNRAPKKPNRETITAELIYYWMIAYNIPFECQKWHLNKLLTLIHVCSIKADKNAPKMSRSEILSQNRALNEARRKALHSKG